MIWHGCWINKRNNVPEVKSADLILNSRQDGLFHNNLWLFVNNCARTQIIIIFIFSLSTYFCVTMFQILNYGINTTNNQA